MSGFSVPIRGVNVNSGQLLSGSPHLFGLKTPFVILCISIIFTN